MIEVKPNLKYKSTCPYCKNQLEPKTTLWQGIHVCVESRCSNCCSKIVEDLKIGHAIDLNYQVNLQKEQIFGHEGGKGWLGEPLLKSLQNPQYQNIEIKKEVFRHCQQVIILNCVDYLYGHCLLKLLNAQRHLDNKSEYGLVIIVQKFLRWMVPDGVAEVWTVDIPLKKGQNYFISLNKFVHEESSRFNKIYLSEAFSHPKHFDINRFTKVPKHNFAQSELKVTFIWREDRLWINFYLFQILNKVNLIMLALILQNRKVKKLFSLIRAKVPSAKFAIAGLGKTTKFPSWIEDYRVSSFDENSERNMCKIYSESRLVIGLHGSNLLLPSGHAGMTINLMPTDRWGNFAQDVLYQEEDFRISAFRYRYFPAQTSTAELAHIASTMVLNYYYFKSSMTTDKSL